MQRDVQAKTNVCPEKGKRKKIRDKVMYCSTALKGKQQYNSSAQNVNQRLLVSFKQAFIPTSAIKRIDAKS